ncbi:thiamine pyrophosphokinase [Caldisericum exile AZM16c01]|uniref:Thiamine diphosphokinase n=1 Tax=Caldisericum exile (strain DSM 21853 / NBRC 104410 / AZM16c01) TaxID=511051 RepID=A0A7U6GDX2_CALEA|nr:thiamine pyrophosphokinase [Caldisericum exile AZM16c01]
MKRCLLVGNGAKNPPQFLRDLAKSVDFVIGVDAGAETLLESGVKVDLAIGDFDSLRNKDLLKKINHLEYPKEKDYSDTEIAVTHALSLGYDEIILTNMLGGRTDHLLFNLSILYRIFKEGKSAKILENKEEIYIFNSSIEVKTDINDIISIFPLLGKISFKDSRGLYYPLTGKSVELGETLTLSNYAVSNSVFVEIEESIAILILKRAKPKYT